MQPVPMLQEASDLAESTRDATVAKTLVTVGLAPQSFKKLSVATDAARAAQSEWAVTRDRTMNRAQANLEEEGYALRWRASSRARTAVVIASRR